AAQHREDDTERDRTAGGGEPAREDVRAERRERGRQQVDPRADDVAAHEREAHSEAELANRRPLAAGSAQAGRSSERATPCPTPTHRLTSARLAPRRRSSKAAVITSLTPLAPSGCPRAIATPFGFTCAASSASPSARVQASTCAAKASLSSTTS